MKVLNRLFIALTAIALATMLVSVSARAGSLTFDAAGNLFVADPYSESILKFTPEGKKSTFATSLKKARDLIFDSKGYLFASDFDQKSIFKFAPDGKKSTLATAIKVFDMVIDDSDNLYVSDGDSILKFTPDGNKSTFTTGISAFGLAIDRSGNVYVSGGDAIFKLTPDGKKSTFASGFHSLDGLVFDRSGNLFVADSSNHAIFKFAPDGTQSTFASEISAYELAFDRAGNLFVSTSHSVFKFAPDGNKSRFAGLAMSPDKKWEYQEPVDEEGPKIVKIDTNEVALELDGVGGVDWAPDSRRFACDSGGGGRSHTIFLYQLRGDEWKELKEPIDAVYEILKKAIAAQVKKSGLPKKTDLRLIWEKLELRRWVDSNTAILYAGLHEAVRENVERRFDVDFVFTLKFDADGNSKIVKAHQMSDKEIEREEAGEDVSGSGQTTKQEKPSADASFSDADRHLNEVYNALRARLSLSERDTLKKEQLAWLKRRDAAAQVAKGNAQEKSTETTDSEVTKMTRARVAELEKRLKKAK
jgi:uncharacterized protein YecT (DUF1311 family)